MDHLTTELMAVGIIAHYVIALISYDHRHFATEWKQHIWTAVTTINIFLYLFHAEVLILYLSHIHRTLFRIHFSAEFKSVDTSVYMGIASQCSSVFSSMRISWYILNSVIFFVYLLIEMDELLPNTRNHNGLLTTSVNRTLPLESKDVLHRVLRERMDKT